MEELSKVDEKIREKVGKVKGFLAKQYFELLGEAMGKVLESKGLRKPANKKLH